MENLKYEMAIHHTMSPSRVLEKVLDVVLLSCSGSKMKNLVCPIFDKIFLVRLLQRFSNLKKIQVCNFKGDIDEAVLAIARSGLDLEELVALSYCRSYPEFWLEELGTNMKNLKVLKFTGGDGDADFVRVVDAFLQLEELQIEDEAPHYNSVTDEGRDYMSSKLKRLRKIDLSNKSRISDKSLISLSKNCPLLEHIEIHDCNFVTQEGISFLVNNSHHLNSLYIYKYLKIDSFGVKGSTNPNQLKISKAPTCRHTG
ncbi:F-box/LRR-repeat protein 2-like [Chenopodium quinoa]|uniref:F-box/LRR-repeat protein 2-like n=1 Tax=Chenopodium quinoa TaxID=63459 RepID=UPI000B79143B|nr:F-box/LRR-repeat protein 2-like [Chenopodium quinoa]